MSATSLEKQKKGSIYVYKFSTGSRTPEYQPPARSTTKKIIPSSVWGSLRKSKSKSKPKEKEEVIKEMDHGKGKPSELTVQQQQQPSVIPLITKDPERERKSVSSVESILMSFAKSNDENTKEGRKSMEENNKGRELFPFPRDLLLQGKEEGARKSISHVENNVAYVGKFVENPRKSIGVKLESDVVSAIEVLQVKVLVTDMPGFMQIQAFQCARKTYDSLEKFSAKHMAYNLKKEFDKVYGPAWHCIVGSSFGSFVTHATGCFLYFSIEKLCILLFRTKVQRILQQ